MSTKFFPMNLAKFKRVSSDKNTTTLKHDDGHEIKIAHNALSPKLRGNLAALPQHEESSGKPTKAGFKSVEVAAESKYAEGGQISDAEFYEQEAKKLEAAGDAKGAAALRGQTPPVQKAKGGDVVASPTPQPMTEEEQLDQDTKDLRTVPEYAKRFKNGGDIDPMDVTDQAIAPSAPKMSPEQVATQGLYNQELSMPAGKGFVQRPGGIDAQGQTTSAFDPDAYARAEDEFKNQQMKKQAAEQSATALTSKQSAAMQRAGVSSPLSAPESAQPAQPAQPTPGIEQPKEIQPQVAEQTVPQQVPQPTYQQAVDKQIKGIQGEANALSQEAKDRNAALRDSLSLQQQAEQAYHTKYQELDAERRQFQQDILDQHIDPQHYLNSMGTGSRIATGIGLILGGMGGGLTHQENPALKFLNQQIDRDIASQQAELGKKENLLSANMKQFGNLHQAIEMTRIMQNDIVATRLGMAAAKSGSPLAQAKAQQAIGALQKESAIAQNKLTMAMTVNSAVDMARKDPSKAQNILDMVRTVDPKRAEELSAKLVPGVGFANTAKDASDVKESKAGLDNATQGIKRLQEINKVHGKSLSPSLRAEASTIQQTLVGLLRLPITGPGAMNEGERKMLEGIIANPTALFSLDSSNTVRLDALKKKLEQGYDNLLKSKGLTAPDPIKSLTPQQKTFVDWAKKNPADPKSPLILEKLGIK